MKQMNENGIEVRKDRDETRQPRGSYYHCEKCGYDNTDISDVTEDVCWVCGSSEGLEIRNI